MTRHLVAAYGDDLRIRTCGGEPKHQYDPALVTMHEIKPGDDWREGIAAALTSALCWVIIPTRVVKQLTRLRLRYIADRFDAVLTNYVSSSGRLVSAMMRMDYRVRLVIEAIQRDLAVPSDVQRLATIAIVAETCRQILGR